MVDRPTVYPKWADADETDPVSGQSNVVEPPTAREDSGWTRREIPPRQWMNWLHRFTYRWIAWFDQELQAATNEETPSVLAKRDAAGRMRAVDPVDPQDVATKSYVDPLRGILSADYFDEPVSVALFTLGGTQATAIEAQSYEDTLDVASLSGVSSDAKFLLLHVGLNKADASGVSKDQDRARFGIKKPTDTNYKWLVGTYNSIPNENEPAEYIVVGGSSNQMWFPVVNGQIDYRMEMLGPFTSISISADFVVLAEIV